MFDLHGCLPEIESGAALAANTITNSRSLARNEVNIVAINKKGLR